MKSAKTSWKHIRRSPYQSIAAIFIMMLTFLAMSVFAFIVFGSSVVIDFFESRPQVTAFFKNEATQDEMDALKTQLEATGKVSGIRYISKQQALEIYRKQNSGDPLLLDLVTEDILPASFEISTYKVEDLAYVSDTIKDSPIIDRVIYNQQIVEQLTAWTNAIRIIGITLIAILALVSIVIMMTVIGFKVSQKKDEIEIMKLLSATNWYIRWPFILEGIFYGVVGTFVGWLIASAGLFYATPYLKSFIGAVPLLPVSPVFLLGLLVAELIVAVILGMLASYLAVLRYLK